MSQRSDHNRRLRVDPDWHADSLQGYTYDSFRVKRWTLCPRTVLPFCDRYSFRVKVWIFTLNHLSNRVKLPSANRKAGFHDLTKKRKMQERREEQLTEYPRGQLSNVVKSVSLRSNSNGLNAKLSDSGMEVDTSVSSGVNHRATRSSWAVDSSEEWPRRG